MIAGRNLFLFATLLLCLIFLFRRYALRLKKESGYPLFFFISLSLLFFISFFLSFLRIYLLSNFGLLFGDLLSYLFIFSVISGGGQPLPLPAPSGTEGSDSV